MPVEEAARVAARCRLTTVSVVGLVSVVAFEVISVATAMPVAARDLGGVREYGLVFSSFLTASLLGTVAGGSWCDAKGPRWPVLAGLGLFGVGAATAGTAASLPVLLVGRFISGGGAGALMVSLFVVVALVYDESARPRLFAWISAAWVLPALVGPLVAGWLASAVSWRAVFLVVVPLVGLAGVALLPRLGAVAARPAAPGVVDAAAGADGSAVPRTRTRLLLALGLALGAGLVQYAAQALFAPMAVSGVLVGLLVLALTLPPLLPRGTLRLSRGLPAVIAVRGLFTAAFFGAETFLPLMLVSDRGLSPTLAGSVLSAGAVGWFSGSWLQGRKLSRLDRPMLLVLGGAVLALAVCLLIPTVHRGVPVWLAGVAWLLGGLGMGLGATTASVLTLALSEPGQEGLNSGAMQLSDGLGGVLGIGAAGAVFSALHHPGDSDAAAFGLIWAGLALVGVAAAVGGARARTAEPAGPGPRGHG